MTTATIFSDAADDYLSSVGASFNYAAARDGTGTLSGPGAGNFAFLGQDIDGSFNYTIYEAFLSFDLSSISAGATITSPVLNLSGEADNSTTDFTIDAMLYDWGAGVTTADWRNGAALAALTLLCSRSSSGWTTAGYNAFTESGSALRTAIAAAAGGTLRMVLASHNQVANTAPSTSEYVGFWLSEKAGTTQDPYLTFDWTPAAGVGQPTMRRFDHVPHVRLGRGGPNRIGG